MAIRLERRPQASAFWRFGAPVLAALLTVAVGFILFLALGKNPLTAFHTFFIAPIDDLYGLGELGVKAAPLMLIGLGLAIGFRAGVWNIGAEGQLTLGAIAGGGLAVYFSTSDSAWLLPLMLVMGAIGGLLWAAVPALLRSRFNANEILVSLMLNYVALLLLDYLVRGPWRDPEGYNFPESALFPEAGLLPVLLEGTRLHIGLVIALVAVLLSWLFVQKSYLGYQMRVSGLAEVAAHYAGFKRNRMIWLGMLCGGVAAGLAGVCEVAGPIGQLLPTISPGYGYAAIIVAFVGRLHPVGVMFASLLLALLYLGGEAAQIELGLPSSVTGLFQGMLLFFLLVADLFILYRVRKVGIGPKLGQAA